MPKKNGKRDQPAAENVSIIDPGGNQPPEPPPAPGPQVDPELEPGTVIDDPDPDDEPIEKGPLSLMQDALRELLDYDQITEVRLALTSREEELEKHLKKGSQLGVFEEDARRRLRLIVGSDTKFGLTRIFAPEAATETRDLFFDREKPNGRPAAAT